MDDDEFSSSSSSSSSASFASCCDPPHYAFSGKLMLISVLLFVFVCLLVAFFHLYSNRFLLRRARRRRHHHLNSASPIEAVSVSSQGLDPSLLKSLPVFVYKAEFYKVPIECPVCLSEFENGETGRVLPKCSHCFHCECIDMWFQSHSSCPICRAPIQPLMKPIEVKENPSELEGEAEVVIMVAESAIDEVQRRPCDFSSSESSQSYNDGKKSVGMIAIITS